jgi:hypothetical protein
MKRLITLFTMFALLCSGMVMATETRLQTLGNNFITIMDEDNVFYFPSVVNKYPRLVVADFGESYSFPIVAGSFKSTGTEGFGGFDFNRVGAHWQFSQDSDPWVLGAYFSTQPIIPPILSYYYNNYYIGPPPYPFPNDLDGNSANNNRITLLYGRMLGENPFGVSLSYVNSSEKWDGYGAGLLNRDFSISAFQIMAGLTLADGAFDVAGGVTFATWKDELDYLGPDEALEKRTEPSGNMMIDLYGRYWMEIDDDWTGVPHAEFQYIKQGLDDFYTNGPTNPAIEHRWTDFYFSGGYGINYEPGENVLLAGDIGFQVASFKTEIDGTEIEKESHFQLPYFKVGLEAKMLKWLTGRVGVSSIWDWGKLDETNPEEIKANNVSTTTYAGLQFNWSNWMIDAGLNQDFLRNGPNFISGHSTDGYLFPKVSVLYMFGGTM